MAWHTQDWVKGGSVVALTMKNEMRKKEEERDEQMAERMTNIDLLAKQMMGVGTKSDIKRQTKVLSVLESRIKVEEIDMVNGETAKDNGSSKIELEEMIGTTIEVQICMYLPKNLILLKTNNV
ncbi:hypothetical protein KY290_017263 [Solanum tuberosum]|uniref:Uncharacterized protein n=1 Tax=Solanum tuberosum TaxID=4113 RepID=A0ABQ7VAU2_SOLTU|nr:hypothetical protein KY290_017263 [Solanum tuberosum]